MDSKTKKKTPKQQRKAVLSVLLVVAILITTAFAFLSATDSKTNVFTVGSVSIKLTEKFDTDLSGVIDEDEVYDASNATIHLEDDKSIVPGQKVIKQPYITNNGKNSAYVYMVVGIPTDISDNVYNDRGTYTSKSELAVKVNAYAIQEQYNGATDAESTWTNYFKNDMISGTASDAGIELFTLNDGTSAVTTGTHTIGSDWQEFSTPYSVNDGGNTYRYHFFKYTANNGLLSVNSTTKNLFEYVVFNENIGGPTPPEPHTASFIVKEDSTTTLSGTTNLNVDTDIPEGYYVFESKELLPGESIEMPIDNSLAKDGYYFDWVDIDTKESGYQNMSMPDKDVTFVATYNAMNTENVSATDANFLAYQIGYNESYGGLYARLVNRSLIGGIENIESFPDVPSSIDYIAIPNSIIVSADDYRSDENIYCNSYGAISDANWDVYNAIHANNQTQSVQIPVKEIQNLWDIENATTVCLPDNVAVIKDARNMPNLEKINIPYSCTQIGTIYDGIQSSPSGFYNCPKLTEIILPQTLKIIGQNAFYQTNITDITIPNSVEKIDYAAFQYSKLTSITLSTNIKEIGDLAFASCSLDTIDFSSFTKLERIGASAFDSAFTESTSLLIPESVKSIGEQAFSDTGFTSVTIPDSVKAINKNTFSFCDNLSNVSIGKGVETIDVMAFYCCRSLTNVNIPENVKSIGNSAFESCENLTSITIPNTITSIGDSAFSSCYNLRNVTYQGTVSDWANVSSSNAFNAGVTITCTDGTVTI